MERKNESGREVSWREVMWEPKRYREKGSMLGKWGIL